MISAGSFLLIAIFGFRQWSLQSFRVTFTTRFCFFFDCACLIVLTYCVLFMSGSVSFNAVYIVSLLLNVLPLLYASYLSNYQGEALDFDSFLHLNALTPEELETKRDQQRLQIRLKIIVAYCIR